MTSLLCTEPRTILILGTGYLGRALAERLREAGHIPLTADIDPQQAIYEADMTDSASMHRLAARIPEPCLIVMCASTRGGGTEAYRNLYTRGAENTLEAFPGKPVIFCSSTSVYGITDGRWVTEEHNVYPPRKKGVFFSRRNRPFWPPREPSYVWRPSTDRDAASWSPTIAPREPRCPATWTDG